RPVAARGDPRLLRRQGSARRSRRVARHPPRSAAERPPGPARRQLGRAGAPGPKWGDRWFPGPCRGGGEHAALHRRSGARRPDRRHDLQRRRDPVPLSWRRGRLHNDPRGDDAVDRDRGRHRRAGAGRSRLLASEGSLPRRQGARGSGQHDDHIPLQLPGAFPHPGRGQRAAACSGRRAGTPVWMERLMAMAQTTTDTAIEQATEQTSAADWLEPLEAKVRAAAERIQALKEENATLHRRIEELEERLTAPSQDDNASRWEEEKREIRERVERLTKTLEDAAGV